jgi:hypothetical protein
MKTKVAKALLRQRDPQQRSRLILIYSAALLGLFLAHGYFSNLASPMKLIPQTITAIGMGHVISYILSLRRFGHVADFIDWTKITGSAGPSAGGVATAPPTSA